ATTSSWLAPLARYRPANDGGAAGPAGTSAHGIDSRAAIWRRHACQSPPLTSTAITGIVSAATVVSTSAAHAVIAASTPALLRTSWRRPHRVSPTVSMRYRSNSGPPRPRIRSEAGAGL